MDTKENIILCSLFDLRGKENCMMENFKVIDNYLIGIILGRYKKIACFGGKVFAINADNRIRHLLMISGLHKIVEIME